MIFWFIWPLLQIVCTETFRILEVILALEKCFYWNPAFHTGIKGGGVGYRGSKEYYSVNKYLENFHRKQQSQILDIVLRYLSDLFVIKKWWHSRFCFLHLGTKYLGYFFKDLSRNQSLPLTITRKTSVILACEGRRS